MRIQLQFNWDKRTEVFRIIFDTKTKIRWWYPWNDSNNDQKDWGFETMYITIQRYSLPF